MRYLIWSLEKQAWWKPNRTGYTKRYEEAGIYNNENADHILEHANHAKIEEVAIPLYCTQWEHERKLSAGVH